MIRWVIVRSVGEPDHAPQALATDRRDVATAAAFAQMCRLPHEVADRQVLLSRMAHLAAAAVPGGSAVSITLGPIMDPEAVAGDSDLAQSADWLQMDAGEGPGHDAGRTLELVLAARIGTDRRWRAWPSVPVAKASAASWPSRSGWATRGSVC